MFGRTARSSFSSLIKQDDAVSPSEYTKKTKQRLQQIYKYLESNQETTQMA